MTKSKTDRTLLARIPYGWLVAALVLLAGLLRFFDLGADPSPFKRYGDISDEGGMAHNARLYALSLPCVDEFVAGDSNAALMSILLRVVFKVFGVSFVTTHIISAFAGTALVAVLATFATAEWGRKCGLATAALGAVTEVGIIYSRLGIPEMLQTLCLTIAVTALIRNRRGAAPLAGAFMALAFLVKVTAVYYGAGILAILWYSNQGVPRDKRQGMLSRLLWFGAAGVAVMVPWVVFWYWPNWPLFSKMIRATVDNDTDGRILSTAILQVLTNYFWGFPSVALLSLLAIVATVDRKIRAGDRALNALLIWMGAFLLMVVFSSDKSDRRFVPLIAPLIAIGGRVLGGERAWSSGWRGCAVAIAGLAFFAYDAFSGSLVNALNHGPACTTATIALIAAGAALLYFLRHRYESRMSRLAASVALMAFLLPSFSSLILRTHTLRDSSRLLDQQFGTSFVVGPLAHILSLEAHFYPVFYAMGAAGIKRINPEFDGRKFAYQLVIPRIATEYGPVGLARHQNPVRTGELRVLPNFVHHARWVIDVYDLKGAQPSR